MSAAALVRELNDLGIIVAVADGKLRLTGAQPPPEDLRDKVRSSKAEILKLLSGSNRDSWSSQDWRALFEERAAVLEFDHGLSRADAEARALAICIPEWDDAHWIEPLPDQACVYCGNPTDHTNALPVGTRSPPPWVHRACWSDFMADRVAQATAVLTGRGMESA